jgi:hypothetical protein
MQSMQNLFSRRCASTVHPHSWQVTMMVIGFTRR